MFWCNSVQNCVLIPKWYKTLYRKCFVWATKAIKVCMKTAFILLFLHKFTFLGKLCLGKLLLVLKNYNTKNFSNFRYMGKEICPKNFSWMCIFDLLDSENSDWIFNMFWPRLTGLSKTYKVAFNHQSLSFWIHGIQPLFYTPNHDFFTF